MWKWLVGGIAALVVGLGGLALYLSDKVYLRFDHAAVSAGDFERRHDAAALKADFAHLTATIERLHPDFAAVSDRPAYEAKKAEILGRLDRPMTRAEFYRVAAAINGTIRDGHTGLRRPQEEWDAYKAAGGKVPPFVPVLDETGIVAARSLDEAIPAGARLSSINGVAAVALRDRFAARVSGEAAPYRRAYAADRFAALAYEEGLRPPYTVAFTGADGKPGAATLAGVSFAAWDKAQSAAGADDFSLTIQDRVAILTLNTLEAPQEAFRSFLKSAFARIRDEGATTLILDLRRNGGGDSRQGDHLQTYLSDDALPAMSEVAVKASPEVKAIYRTLLPEGFRWIPIHAVVPMLKGIQEAPDGGFFRFDPDGAAPKPRGIKNKLAFKGDLYVLTSPVTYSSAVIFAAPLKHWKRATFVGQPAGEPLTFYGDNYEFDLPNTHLQASVSHKAFTLLGSKGPESLLQPDILVPDNGDALAVAKAIIEQKRARAGVRSVQAPAAGKLPTRASRG